MDFALLRMEPTLPEGSRPSRAGRRDPFRAPDTDPSLVGRQGNSLFRAHALTELGIFVAVPLVTTLKCWSWFAGAFSRPCAVP